MRISSRGTVSMGPVGWLVALPFLAMGLCLWLAVQLLVVLVKGTAAGIAWLLEQRRRT